ncbi:hypothetical protein FA95DRAFT_1613035 [Auriscalpium vulgare]|uniref:Uncharacterized protein n=1 Tax=Auriscalpium vulgare TaxID=40419 RepID=A0ACB8R5N4_9AGAM|nr:hypothetical protein FA95DRAFT_1613035 [Auriscalpium vulgare]
MARGAKVHADPSAGDTSRRQTRQQTGARANAGPATTTKTVAKRAKALRDGAASAEEPASVGDVAHEPASSKPSKRKKSSAGRKRALTSGEAPAQAKKAKKGAQEAGPASEDDDIVVAAAQAGEDEVIDGLNELHVDEGSQPVDDDGKDEYGEGEYEDEEVTDAPNAETTTSSTGSADEESEEGSAVEDEGEEEDGDVVRAPGGKKRGKAAARRLQEAVPTFVELSGDDGSGDDGRVVVPLPQKKAKKSSKRPRIDNDDTDSGGSRAELQPTATKKPKDKSSSTQKARKAGASTTLPPSTAATAAAASHAAAGTVQHEGSSQLKARARPKPTPVFKPSPAAKAKGLPLPTTTPIAHSTSLAASPAHTSTQHVQVAAPSTAAPSISAAPSAPDTPATPAISGGPTRPSAPATKPRRAAMHAGPGPKAKARKEGNASVNDVSLDQEGGQRDNAAGSGAEFGEEEEGEGFDHEGGAAGVTGQPRADEGRAANREWPAHTNLVYLDNKPAALPKQRDEVRQVITEANTKQLPRTLCWRHAMPAPPLLYDIVREALINAADECGQDDIKRRLEADKLYARSMGSISTQGRCSTFRSESYKKAQEVDFYKLYKLGALKTTEKIAEAVAELLKQPIVTFTYSGDPLLRKYDKDEPFCHAAIVAVLRVLFFSKKRYQAFPEGLFRSSYEEGEEADEPELPMAMVAYAATIVGSWLKQYQSGTFMKVQFSTTAYSGMYNNLLGDLKEIKRANLQGFHEIMNDLYRQVMGISAEENTDPAAVGQSQSSSNVDFSNVGIKKKGARSY